MHTLVAYRDSISAVVRLEMATQSKSSRELARVLNVSHDTARRRLIGEVSFNVDELEKIADWLGSRPSELAHRAEQQTSFQRPLEQRRNGRNQHDSTTNVEGEPAC
jgi:transcriptional regulator with XRE-family HTH domain